MSKAVFVPVLLSLLIGASVFAAYRSNTQSWLRSEDEDDVYKQFLQWKEQYHKKYSNAYERRFRYYIFQTNLQDINNHNLNATSTYKLGLNEFSDLTTEEFNSQVLTPNNRKNTFQRNPSVYGIPDSVDYRNRLTPIQNQGNCASGWAFATTENNNFQYQHFQFSVQNLIDCVIEPQFEADGCKNGNAEAAFKYINQQGQSLSGIYLPYTAQQNECQNRRRGYPVGPMSRGIALNDQYFELLQTTILSASVDASNWKNYASGIFDGCLNNNYYTEFNHVINIVGYNIPESYLIIRNSWGTSWGESGYLKLSFKQNPNPCGVFTSASYFIN